MAVAAAVLVLLVLLLGVRAARVVAQTHSARRAPPRKRTETDEATLAVFLGSGEPAQGQVLDGAARRKLTLVVGTKAVTRPR